MDSLPSVPSPSSASADPGRPPPEHPAVVICRVLVTGGGAVYLAATGVIPGWGVLVVLGCLAMPAQAGAILDIVRGRR